MAIAEPTYKVFEYKLPRLGVNMYKNPTELHEEEAVYTQNLIYRNGLVKRGGSTKWDNNEVVATNPIVGLHRFYYGSASKQTLATSGTIMKYSTGSGWTNAKTGLTDDQPMHMVTWLDKAFCANNVDTPFTWNGTTATDISDATIPSPAQFLPYQDRMLAIQGGDLVWSASFDETAAWETVANCGVRPDSRLYGMTYHSQTNTDSGYQAMVLIAGASGMYLFSGTDLRVPYTTGNYTIFPLATPVGCEAARTMVWTPKGTMWLGNDKQVYLLPFQSSTPVPVGLKIWSLNYASDVEGIEDASTAWLNKASAVYHDGFYKLSLTESGGTFNTIQWWLDVERLYKDDDGHYGPWYGPMEGNNISYFAVMDGPGDGGNLLGGEGDSTVGSFVYQLDQRGVFADVGTAIQTYWFTRYHPLGHPYLTKTVDELELELKDLESTLQIGMFDIIGQIANDVSIGVSGSAVTYWNDDDWGVNYWTGVVPARVQPKISPSIQPRRLAFLVKNNNAIEEFELYALRAKAKEQSKIFE